MYKQFLEKKTWEGANEEMKWRNEKTKDTIVNQERSKLRHGNNNFLTLNKRNSRQ